LRAVCSLPTEGVVGASGAICLNAVGTIAIGGDAGLLADAGVTVWWWARGSLAASRGTVADEAIAGCEALRVVRANSAVRSGAVAASTGGFSALGIAQELV
jgi:hypothetical protein